MIIGSRDMIQLNIRLNQCNHLICSPRWHKENDICRQSKIYYIEDGAGYLQLDNETILLEPGYVYLIPSQTRHNYGCSGMKKLYFIFSLTS